MRFLLLAMLLVPATGHAWQALLPGTPDNGRPFSIAADASGDVLVAGRVLAETGDDDGVLAKLAGDDGAVLWQQRFDGAALPGPGGEDAAAETLRGLVIAPNGDAVGSGLLVGAATGADMLVTRRASVDGASVWQVLLDGGAGLADDAQAVAIDANGDVLVAGMLTPTGETAARPAVMKLAGDDGTEIWRMVLPDGGGIGRALALDAGGDAYVAGDAGANWLVTKRAGADGGELWRTDLPGDPGNAVARALALRPGGAPVVAGRLYAAATGPEFTVVALSPAGAEQWRYALDGTATGAADVDEAFGVAVDAAGDVLAVGTVSNLVTDDDLVVVKLDGATGAEEWRLVVNGSNDNDDDAAAVALGAAGDVLVVGSIRNAGSARDLAVLSIDGASGVERWRRVVNGVTAQGDQGNGGAIDADGNVLVAGRTRNGASADGFTVLKLAPATGGDFPCGNGTIEDEEPCDDANLALGDGCRPDCTVEACGDHVQDPQEGCDDGNTIDGDCCSAGCTVEANGSPCEDGNACTLGDACAGAVCQSGAAKACPATNDCHQATCDQATGQCGEVMRPNGRLCDDGDACTVIDECVSGECQAGLARICDDFDPCTADACTAASGCTFEAYTSFAGVSCAFDPTRVATFCFAGLPAKIEKGLGRAEARVEKAAASSKTGRARRFLKSARTLAEQARRRAAKQTAKGALSAACGAALDDVLSDVGTRALALRDELANAQ